MRKNKMNGICCQHVRNILLIVTIMLLLVACGKKQEPMRAPEDVKTVSIETSYGYLAFPEETFESLHHMEVTDGVTVMEVFYMVTQEGELELFRIYFDDENMGTPVGYLTVDGIEVPVSYSLCEYADEDFVDEETRKLYHSMMNGFSVVVNSIYEDTRFSETRAVEEIGDREVKLRHWKVTLPENVQYTETDENGNYRVDFFGIVGGERIDLYMIGLGDIEGETTLGTYTVNGVQKAIVVQTYDMGPYDIWPEEDRTVIYNMMNSINSVIQTIVEDKNYAELEAAA